MGRLQRSLPIVVVLSFFAIMGIGLPLPQQNVSVAQAPDPLETRVASLETRVSRLEGTPDATHTPTVVPDTATPTNVPVTDTPTAVPDTVTPVPSDTPVPPTNTVIPSTETPIPTNTATATTTATSTVVPPASPSPTQINTPTPAAVTPTPVAVAGQECPVWVHAQYTTLGPDGATYPTWHPAIDPTYQCWFAHEHGDDPRLSLANPTLPAFGYIGLQAGDSEPHTGFKVAVQNHGSVNEDGRTIAHDSRLVFHMGTSGPARFTTRYHSLQFDFKEVGGTHEAHVMGMADTSNAGSICQDRQAFPKTVMVLPNLCHTDSPYEIWTTRLRLADGPNGARFEVNSAWGVFDPFTIMDPADPTRSLLMKDYYPQYTQNPVGAKRELYACPCYYANGSGGSLFTFRTDAYGVESANGPLVQVVSRHNDLGVPMVVGNPPLTQAKLQSYHQNNPRLRSPN